MSDSRSSDPAHSAPQLDANPSDAGSPRFPGDGAAGGAPPAGSWEPGTVEVKLRAGVGAAVVRTRSGASPSQIASDAGADLSGLNQLLAQHQLQQAEPTFQRSEAAERSADATASDTDSADLQRFITLHFPDDADTVQIANALAALPEVELAAPIPQASPPQTPWNEPLVGTGDTVVLDAGTGLENQWYVFRCGVDAAWGRSSGNGVVVADIDWGYRISHEELATRLDTGRAYNSADGGTNVSHGSSVSHGTAVMGIAGAADNGRGMAGIAYGASLWPVQANSGPGTSLGGNSWARAIDWVRTTGSGGRRKVIILEVQTTSFGNYEMVPSVNAAIQTAIAAGVVVCVAAGNGNRDAGMDDLSNTIPDTGSILVAATEYDATQNRRAGFSNFNARISVAAPGDSSHDLTCSSSADNAYRNGFGGTSGATPKVAATAALMLQVNDQLTHAQIKAILNETGSAVVTDAAKPVGRFLDADAAVQRAASLAAGWKYNLAVNSVFAHSLSRNAQANLTGLGWRMIAPDAPEDVTRPFDLLSEAAVTHRKVHVFTEANGRISSAQLA